MVLNLYLFFTLFKNTISLVVAKIKNGIEKFPKKSKHFRGLSLYLPFPPLFVTSSGCTGWNALFPCLISGASSGLNQLFTHF